MGPDSILHFRGPLRLLRRLVPAAAVLCLPATALAQAQSESADTRAIIVRPLSLTNTRTLDFGDIIPGTTPGTVRILTNGNRTSTGGVVPVNAVHSAGQFTGRGGLLSLVVVTIAGTSIQITGPGAPMTVDNFEIGETATFQRIGNSVLYRIQGGTGIFDFTVGARLTVLANQAPGVYTGTYTVNYNYL